MIDPGRPFGVPFASVIDALEQRVRFGVERAAIHAFAFQAGVVSYVIPDAVHAVIRVFGFVGSRSIVLDPELHYRVAGGRLIFIDPTFLPDNGKRVEVEYTTLERPPGITDFNQGSVIGTLVRAVAREFTQVYAQMDEAYRRAFIDQSSGPGLDNVVALLGVTRTEAQPAEGKIKFFRKTGATQTVRIAKGTRVADKSGRVFVTQEDAEILPGGRDVLVAIRALEPGAAGNVNADTISVMPTPPRGVDGVANPTPMTGGQEAEPDDRLRDRAKHALERAGNATLNAIKFAVLGVDGVEGAEVIDHTVDDSIPPGEVRVRFSGGRREDVSRAVEATRAAGILARLESIQTLLISGKLYLVPGQPPGGAVALATYLTRVTSALQALAIGEPLSLKRIAALAFDVPGLAELAEAQLDFTRADTSTGPVNDPFLIAPIEIIRPNVAAIEPILLRGLSLVSSAPLPAPGRLQLTLAVLDSSDTAVEFRNFTLDLSVAIRAFSLTAPDDPPERIGTLAKKLVLAANASADVAISAAELSGFRPADHSTNLELAITCPASPGIAGIVARADIGP